MQLGAVDGCTTGAMVGAPATVGTFVGCVVIGAPVGSEVGGLVCGTSIGGVVTSTGGVVIGINNVVG